MPAPSFKLRALTATAKFRNKLLAVPKMPLPMRGDGLAPAAPHLEHESRADLAASARFGHAAEVDTRCPL